MAYIYKIINDINDKVYIGKTENDIQTRFRQHCADSKRQSIEKRPLYRAMNKYGLEHFHIELIEETNNPEEREIYWIEQYDSYHKGYNATLGGDGKCLYDHEAILALLKENPSPKMIADQIGCCTDIVCQIAKNNNIEVINIGGKDKAKQVHQYNKSTKKYIRSFDSNSEAAAWCYENNLTSVAGKVARTHIGEVARGERKSAYGFIWSYELKDKLD